MKRILFIAISMLSLAGAMAQTTITGDRVVARQGFYLNGKWVDSVQKSGSFTSDRTIPTSKAIANGAIKNQFVNSSEPDFEVDVIPDIQFMNYLSNTDPQYSQTGRSIFNWIANNKTTENIKLALQVGDITDQRTIREWDTASLWFGILDAANVPYVAAEGNHDFDSTTWGTPRLNTNYNTFFGATRMASKSYFVNYFQNDPEGQGYANAFYKLDIGSKKYGILNLEFTPRDTALGWAGKLLDSLYLADPQRQVMVLTHSYQTTYGELATDTSSASFSTDYTTYTDNTGQEIWDKLIKKKANIRWVFSGHYNQPVIGVGYSSRISATGENGNLVEQIFVNYQSDIEGGSGYFMRLKFRPSKNEVDVSFYSDYLHQSDANIAGYTINEPSISVLADFATNGNVAIGKKLRVAGSLNVETLNKGRVPYIGEDHKVTDDVNFRYNPKDGFYTKAKAVFDSTLKVKGFLYTDSIDAPSGVFGINNSRFQINSGTPQFATTSNLISFWRNDIATTTSPSFNKVMEINSYSTFLDGSSGGFHPNALLARAYDLTGTSISYSTGYQDNVFGLFIGAGFDTKTGVSSSAITAGTTPTQALGMNMYKFVNQGSGTRTINGFVANAKFALNCTASGSITSYADIVAGINSGISSTITNRYAFYADDVSDANVTNAYGFYQAGANTQNHFAGKTTFGSIINLPSSTAPTSSADSSGTEGDIKRDASGNLYLRTSTQWLKFAGSTF